MKILFQVFFILFQSAFTYLHNNQNSNNTLIHDNFRMLEFENNEPTNDYKKPIQSRLGIDGRKCKQNFEFNGQEYFDCTNTPSPDGENKLREWCFVEDNEKGEVRWSYCRLELNYDKVRKKVFDEKMQLFESYQQVRNIQETQKKSFAQLIIESNEVEDRQNKIDLEIGQMRQNLLKLQQNKELISRFLAQQKEKERTLEQSKQSLSELQKAKLEATMFDSQVQFDDNFNEQKFFSNDLKEKKSSFIQLKQDESQVEIIPIVKFFVDQNAADCDGMIGYESNALGDGLRAQYFDNEGFIGQPIELIDQNIDFTFLNLPPIKNINSENFSIIWRGFLRAPITGAIKFELSCDNGCELWLNDQVIIQHQMGISRTGGLVTESKNWFESSIGNSNKEHRFNYEAEKFPTESQPVSLLGGDLYPIEIKMFHSDHFTKRVVIIYIFNNINLIIIYIYIIDDIQQLQYILYITNSCIIQLYVKIFDQSYFHLLDQILNI